MNRDAKGGCGVDGLMICKSDEVVGEMKKLDARRNEAKSLDRLKSHADTWIFAASLTRSHTRHIIVLDMNL